MQVLSPMTTVQQKKIGVKLIMSDHSGISISSSDRKQALELHMYVRMYASAGSIFYSH